MRTIQTIVGIALTVLLLAVNVQLCAATTTNSPTTTTTTTTSHVVVKTSNIVILRVSVNARLTSATITTNSSYKRKKPLGHNSTTTTTIDTEQLIFTYRSWIDFSLLKTVSSAEKKTIERMKMKMRRLQYMVFIKYLRDLYVLIIIQFIVLLQNLGALDPVDMLHREEWRWFFEVRRVLRRAWLG